MRMCKSHWEKVKAAVTARGLGHLVSNGGHEAAKRTAAALTDPDNKNAFDPLMTAYLMIVGQAIEKRGPVMLAGPDEMGNEPCPLCCNCGAPNCPGEIRGWIEGATKDVYEQAQKLGLVKSA